MSTLVSSQNLAWHDPLIQFLPLIRSVAANAFYGLDPTEREEAIQEVVANTTVGMVDLAAKGRPHFWLIKPLAQFAVRQWRSGRRVGSSVNKNDVMSDVPRREAFVESLEEPVGEDFVHWRDIVADSRNTDPAEAACFRIDFESWLKELPDWHRQVALALSDGSSTGEIAKQLEVSPGRVSQLRRELRSAWDEFQSEMQRPVTAAVIATNICHKSNLCQQQINLGIAPPFAERGIRQPLCIRLGRGRT